MHVGDINNQINYFKLFHINEDVTIFTRFTNK